jgi:ABC-2 type transport system permease protein
LISIITCFFPFLLASGAIIQERDDHTLEPLLSALKSRWYHLMLGKALLPLFMGLFLFLLMILVGLSFFGLTLKSGFFGILTVQTAAVIGSLFVGLSISCIVASQIYALIASAVYLLCLILLTGFIFPLETASPIIRFLSHFFPLTFTLNPMEDWLFSGDVLLHHIKEIEYLLLQAALYTILALLMIRRLKKSM